MTIQATIKVMMNILDKIDLIMRLIKSRRKFNINNIEKLLIIKSDKLGDAVNSAFIISAIKKTTQKEIHLLTSKKNCFVFDELCKEKIISKRYSIDNEALLDYNANKNFPFGYIKYFTLLFNKNYFDLIKELKNERYDLAVDLVGKRHLAILSNLVSKRTIGPKLSGFTWLYDYGFDRSWTYKSEKHVIENWKDLIEDSLKIKLEIDKAKIPVKKIKIPVRNYILFHIGGTEIRRFENQKIIDIINRISLFSKVVIIDDTGQRHIKKIRNKVKNKNITLIEKNYSLPELAWLAKNSELFITFDGGHMHYLSMFAKILVFWSCGVLEAWMPWDGSKYSLIKTYPNRTMVLGSKNKKHKILVYPTIYRPCFDLGCRNRECLRNIELQQIIETIKSMIKVKV
jgi:ADP-heptose:LPS heptosyltransferase